MPFSTAGKNIASIADSETEHDHKIIIYKFEIACCQLEMNVWGGQQLEVVFLSKTKCLQFLQLNDDWQNIYSTANICIFS